MSKSISVSCLYESCAQADTKSAPAFAQALLLVMFGPAMPATPIRILLADDHGVVRNGFRMLLAAQWDMEVVGEASNGREAVELAEKLAPDVIVMDVTMPELNGIEAARQITKALPKTRILALSMQKDGVYVREMLRAGAKGYLLKDCDEKDLLAAVRAVAVGQGWLSPEVSDAVLEDYRKHVTNPIDLLSPREREVLQLIAESKTNKEIATRLGLSVYTVEAHRGRIMEKLNLHSIGELVRFAIRNGLID
jgi:DNA-binding NarL/FixJ family response regulator